LKICDGCINLQGARCVVYDEIVPEAGPQNCTEYEPKSLEPGCLSCQSLIDGRYCLHWRDLVPADVMPIGCDESDPYPPF